MPDLESDAAKLNQNTRNCGREVARQQTADHRAQTEPGEVAAASRCQRADAADLNGDAGKIREAAKGVGGQRHGSRVESVLVSFDNVSQVEITDKLVKDDALAEDLAERHAIFGGCSHQPGKRGVDPA